MLDDAPPAYELEIFSPSPTYTACAQSSECLLQFERPASTGCPGCDWISETKHMKINMGFRMWGSETPCYGLGGTIEGTVRFSGLRNRVERVTLTLEGNLTTSLTHRNNAPGNSSVQIILNTLELYNSAKGDTFTWDEERPFVVTIPSKVNILGRLTPTPPSYFALHQNVVCEVSYAVKICMARKGSSFNHKIETKTIPILYLPKSSPSNPPVTAIPRVPQHTERHSSLLESLERVKTIPVRPVYPPSYKSKPASESFQDCVHLSLPTPHCFTAGELIPFTMSLVFPRNPMLATILVPTIQIHLVKRLIVRDRKRGESIYRDTCISSAEHRKLKEYTEGVRMIRGFVRAGTAGAEMSWRIKDFVEVQYLLCASLCPPSGLVDHIPSFRHEEVVEIKTDHWGALRRELSSVGGTPTPALGLAKNLRREP